MGSRRADADLFILLTTVRTSGNSMKLGQGRFSFDITKRFFIQRAVGLLWKVVTAPSLTEYKKCLGNSLRVTVWFLGLSSTRPGAGLQWALWIPSSPGYCMILWTAAIPRDLSLRIWTDTNTKFRDSVQLGRSNHTWQYRCRGLTH